MESRVADTVSEGNGRHEFFMGFGSVGVHNLFILLEVSEVTVFHGKEDQFLSALVSFTILICCFCV